MASDPLITFIVKEAEAHEKGKKGEFRFNGGEQISPMHEALVALLRQNLTDAEIVHMARNDVDLRQILAVDALFNQIPANKRNALHSSCSQKDIQVAIEAAALIIADNKRTQDGKVLHCASTKQTKYSTGPARLFMASLKYADPGAVYVEQSAIPGVEKKAQWMYFRRAMGILAVGAALAYGSWTGVNAFIHRHDSDLEQTKIEQLEKTAEGLQKTADESVRDKKNLEAVVNASKIELEQAKTDLKNASEKYADLEKTYNSGIDAFKAKLKEAEDQRDSYKKQAENSTKANY